jgi:hypothetical protein
VFSWQYLIHVSYYRLMPFLFQILRVLSVHYKPLSLAVTLSSRRRMVLGSNLRPHNEYPNLCFSSFSESFQAVAYNNSSNTPLQLPCNSLTIHHSPNIKPIYSISDIQRIVKWTTYKLVSKRIWLRCITFRITGFLDLDRWKVSDIKLHFHLSHGLV